VSDDGAHRDATDEALATGARLAAVDSGYGFSGWRRIGELSLALGRSYHAVLGRSGDGTRLSVKGAPEVLLLQCTHSIRGGAAEPLDDAGRLALFSTTT